MNRYVTRIAMPLMALALLAALPGAALAFHRDTAFLTALSACPGGDSARPAPSRSEPRFIAFDSSCDLLGTGIPSNSRQIFLEDFRIGKRVLGQITNQAGDSRNASVANDATWVAFDSNADFIGNGNTQRQIFLWQRDTTTQFQGIFVQLTNNPNVPCERPHIDENGRWVTFVCDGDLLNRGSVGRHVFVASLNGRCSLPASCPIDQVTYAPGTSDNPHMSGDNRFVFFNSDAAIIGPSNGFQQVYGYDRGSGEIFQLTFGNGNSTRPTTDKVGRFVTFESEADLLAKGVAGTHVYLLDRIQTAPDLRLLQITDVPGQSTKPSLGRGAWYLIFVSNADVLRNGSSGQHVFLYDVRSEMKFQLTDKIDGSSDNPRATGNTIFFFDSSEDIMHTGITGRQVYALNVFGALPSQALGAATFKLLPGGYWGGSRAELKTRNASHTAFLGNGSMYMRFGVPTLDGDALIDVDPTRVLLPPIEVPTFGAICLRATGRGVGTIDCKGGLAEANFVLDHDRNTDTADPACLLGCREGAACWGPVPIAYPGVCNGETSSYFGEFRRGGGRFEMPMAADLSIARGPDRLFCTADDQYPRKDVAVGPMLLSTETANTTLRDSDNIRGTSLSDTHIGAPFGCNRIKTNDLLGARLVAVFPFYNFPIGVLPSVPGPNDLLMKLTFEADKSDPCTPGSCVPEDCLEDDDCNDGNVCNGVETCQSGVCKAGTPLVCNDSNFCNGAEWCDERLGCQLGAPPSCADNDQCTDDTCDLKAGRCVFRPAENCCEVDADCNDEDVCTGTEKCVSGRCQVIAGTVPACDDGNACTQDGCNPTTGCTHGDLPDGNTCSDGNKCNGDEVCLGGACTAGIALTCDDAVTCTEDKCHPFLGCYNPPIENCCLANSDCDDLTVCNGIETCVANTCQKGAPLPCDDGNACNGSETCDPLGGCVTGTPLTCVDAAVCSLDACDPASGCVSTFIPGCCVTDADCNDGNTCNGTETCVAGDCVGGSSLVCNDGNTCNGVEICDPASGCVTGLAPDDFDGVVCTLNAIQRKLQDVGYPALGGRGQSKNLMKLVVGARRKLQLAGRGSGRFARGKIAGAQRQVEKFIHRMTGSESVGRVEPVLAQDLVSMAASTRPGLVRLAVNAPVP